MNIKAKMICAEVVKTCTSEVARLNAVTEYGTPENKTFAANTPSAELKITITQARAFGAFVPGKSYYVDFTPEPDEEAGTQEP